MQLYQSGWRRWNGLWITILENYYNSNHLANIVGGETNWETKGSRFDSWPRLISFHLSDLIGENIYQHEIYYLLRFITLLLVEIYYSNISLQYWFFFSIVV